MYKNVISLLDFEVSIPAAVTNDSGKKTQDKFSSNSTPALWKIGL